MPDLPMRRVVDRFGHLAKQLLGAHDVLELEVQEERRLAVEHALQTQLHDACAVDVVEVDPALHEVAGDDDVVIRALGKRAALDVLCQYPAAIRLHELDHGAPLPRRRQRVRLRRHNHAHSISSHGQALVAWRRL